VRLDREATSIALMAVVGVRVRRCGFPGVARLTLALLRVVERANTRAFLGPRGIASLDLLVPIGPGT
jgi:hypothetical protein